MSGGQQETKERARMWQDLHVQFMSFKLLEDWLECKLSGSASLGSLPCELCVFFFFWLVGCCFFVFFLLLCRSSSPAVKLEVDCCLFHVVCYFFMYCDQLEEASKLFGSSELGASHLTFNRSISCLCSKKKPLF